MKVKNLISITFLLLLFSCDKNKDLRIETLYYDDFSTCIDGVSNYTLDLKIRDWYNEPLRIEKIIVDFGDGKPALETNKQEIIYNYDEPGDYIVTVKLQNKKNEDEDTIHVKISEPALNKEAIGEFKANTRYTYQDEPTTITIDTNGSQVIGAPFEYFNETIEVIAQDGSCDNIEIHNLFQNYTKVNGLKSTILIENINEIKTSDQTKFYVNDSLFFSFGDSFSNQSQVAFNGTLTGGGVNGNDPDISFNVYIDLEILNENQNNARQFEFEFIK
jgi:hypothetical protein